MKKRLCIGILNLSTEWSNLLDDVGVWYEQVDFKNPLVNNYSLIILNKRLASAQVLQVEHFLENGGTVLEMKDIHPFTKKGYIESDDADTLLNRSKHPAFEHIHSVDLYADVCLHKETKLLGGLIHFQVWKKGVVGFFGADIIALFSRDKYHRKKFYSPGNKFPNEIVNSVSKHELKDAFTITLRELHHRSGLPYIQKWTSPKKAPVFCFRIDTDFGDKKSIDNLYEVLNEHQIKGTWFLHVKAHEKWLDHFKTFEEQELALHGYEHGTSNSSKKMQSNIEKGLKLLQKAGIEPIGYCAPYGIHNKALKQALGDFDFRYTSEFTFKYDGFPTQTGLKNSPIQLPIHPICTGSLNRLNYSESDMAAYFAQVMEMKIGRHEPVIFYHHPLQPGLDVISHLMELVNHKLLTNMTFHEFEAFWKRRALANFEAWYENNSIQINCTDNKLHFQVFNTQNGFNRVRAGQQTDLEKTPDFEYSNSYLLSIPEVKNMKAFDIRLIKTSLLDWKNRIRL
ncbi:polysaccharide deacetylase family protein [Gracilimonas sp.]|uniref:polysaccharide deacetylase family protein n=1 Tax=Gracilimonas sp. TaxID=1974203 RepID=UPI0028726064|nr:polysaccharide deacetylase family protein [Gracilimonas sp.]